MTSTTTLTGKVGRQLSHKFQITLAFLLGGAVSSLAQDPSDFVFFWAQSHGYTNTFWTTILWYDVPFLIYIGLFAVGFVLAYSHLVSAAFMIYLLMFLFMVSAIYSLLLPQNSELIFIANTIMGAIVSLGILFGLLRQVR